MRIAHWVGAAGVLVVSALPGAVSAESPPINKGSRPTPSAAATSAPAALVTAPQPNPMEMVYTPIQPCRAFGGQALTTGQTKNFQITGSGNFGSQGGPGAGCGVPASAKAVSINLSASASPSGGYLTAFAHGAPRPGIGSLNMASNTSNTAGSIVAVGPTGRIAIYAARATSTFGDITGYYAPQIQVYMNSDGTAYAATTRILETARTALGQYTIMADRNLQLCTVHITIAGGKFYGSAYPSGSFIYVNTWGISGGVATDIDLYHMVSATC